MKKLLSILVMVLYGVASSWAAEVYTSIQVAPSNGGVASVTGVDYNYDTNTKQTGSSGFFGLGAWYYYTGYIRNTTNGGTITSPSTETVTSWSENGSWYIDKSKTSFYQNAEADVKVVSVTPGYAFEKWTCNSATFTGTFTDATALETTVNYGNTSLTQGGNATITANFKKIITPIQPVIDWTKPAGVESTLSTTVNLFKATNFKVSGITHNRGNEVRTFTCSPNLGEVIENPGNSITLTFTAGTDVEDGDQFVVTLQADNGASETITVNIKSKIVVTFAHPTVGKGSYKAVRSGSDGDTSVDVSNDDADVEMEFSKVEDFYHTFTATPAQGYTFYRWLVNGNENEVLKDNPDGYTLNDGDVITAEFLPTDMAMFIVKNGDGTQYFKLEDAIAAAQSSTSKVVVVEKSGTLYTGHKSLTNGKYEFEIPAGITLLVPGDAAYTVVKKYDIASTEASTTVYRELILPRDTRITSHGDICVFSQLRTGVPESSLPSAYGKITMKENTEITLENGSQLTAYGYILGNPDNSEIIAKSGAHVYEVFQMTSWRGGKATVPLVKNGQRVFPIAQYYVQNVETKLTYKSGALGYVSALVNVNSTDVPMDMLFIGVRTGDETEDAGFICLGDDAELSKWYDGESDRQKYKLSGTQSGDVKSQAKFGIVHVNMDLGWAAILLGGNINLDSRDYVLPFASNISVSIHNINLLAAYDFALLAGTELYVDKDATLVTQGNVFVYDVEQNYYQGNVAKGYFGSTNLPLSPISYTAYHYDKYLSDKTTYSYLSSGKPYSKKDTYIRTTGNLEDAKLTIDGTWIVSSSSNAVDGSGFYTTTYKSETAYNKGISTNLSDYGANITSEKGGKIDFQVIGTKPSTNQVYQLAETNKEWLVIPLTNARLRNGDGTYSAGEGLTSPTKYYYYVDEQKWLEPKFGIPSAINREFTLFLPQPKTQNIECTITTAGIADVAKTNFKSIVFSGGNNSRFTVNDYKYAQNVDADGNVDLEEGKLTISITYNPLEIHNANGSPYTETMTINYEYFDPIEEIVKSDSKVFDLTATEDYTPKFKVEINSADVTTNGTHTFNTIAALATDTANVVITPDENTVAKLLAPEQWTISAVENPTFSAQFGKDANQLSQAKVIFYPQERGSFTGTLTISAQSVYLDAMGVPTSNQVVVALNGEANLQPNTLAFKDELKTDTYTLVQGQLYDDIFASLGSGRDINITCLYSGGEADGQDASALVVAQKKDNGNYTLKTNEVASITEARTVKVSATQEGSSSMAGTTDPRVITITILPPAIWHWADLYFGTENTNPVTPSGEGEWSLREVTDPNNMIELSGTSPNYIAQVANGGKDDVYQATFDYQQGTYRKTFTSNIFADPRVLPYCVEYARQYRGVTNSVSGASFNEANQSIVFTPNSTWEIQMIGMPDTLTFSATGENTWYIGERADDLKEYSGKVVWTKLSGTQKIKLKPTTNQLIIRYGGGSESNGVITNFCISELEVSADQDIVYFPINKDGSESSRTIVLTHTESTAPEITLDAKFKTSLETPEILGSPEEPYYQTTITITDGEVGDVQQVTKGEYSLIAKQGDRTIKVMVYADDFPQGLPIKLANDDTKRYHFIATESENVIWDAATKRVVLQNPGGAVVRSVTFAFEGAPSRISFEASRDIVDTEWIIEESVDGTIGSFKESEISENRDAEAGPMFTHNLQYTTRYVRIRYYSENQSEVTLSNLVIEGDPMLFVNPDELEYSDEQKSQILTLTAINLSDIRITLVNTTDFQMSHGANTPSAEIALSPNDYPNALGVNKVGDIVINTEWISTNLVNDGVITVYNSADNDSVLAKVKLVGAGKYLRLEDAAETGVYTGIPDGTIDPNKKYTYHGEDYEDYKYHQVNLTNAFTHDGTALFDYLFVYGETTPSDGTDITAPSSIDEIGSNARTPYYVYVRDVDGYGNFDRYRFVTMVENANEGIKAHVDGVTTKDSTTYINVPNDASLRVYITGFCPYASTGYTKNEEGVFFFRGMAGSKLDVYLEDAHIFARNKMMNGQPFYARGSEQHKQYNPTFTEGYARGSGGVLVFENMEKTEDLMQIVPFEVTIHTIGNNLLKSNYGCFNYFFGMDPYQISAPIHVRLHSADHVRTTKTTLNFTDEWPTAMNNDGTTKTSKRTNGFLSLQKLNNNAPSIDLGNPLTEVNFRGGQVQLQNAQIVSTNYKTTLAISYRSGEYGGDKVGLKFAYGIGTDSVGGSVNFYDGTITVLPMKVAPAYQQYYLMDPKLNAKGDTIRDANDNVVYTDTTTCLRTPMNTKVYGGSICWLRACQHVTSKGGAPSDGNKLLGQYVYEFGNGDTKDESTGLINSIQFPANVEGLANYYNIYHPDKTYGTESVTPDANNKLYFWVPEGFGGVTAEKDKLLTTWKACMTEISAGFGTLEGSVGGPTPVEQNEEIKYMLYCKIDQNVRNVITAGEGDGEDRVYFYNAPVKVPGVAQGYVGGTYTSVTPSMVGMETQNEVLSDTSYLVTDKIYYVTNATADVWETFTAPFDVEKIWVVETFSEAELIRIGKDSIRGKQDQNLRNAILLEQARHNADFAAFFGVSMAIGTTDSLGTIFNDFIEWGKIEDKKDTLPDGSHKTALYNGQGQYTLRGKYPLIPYYRRVSDSIANFDEAHFYLNENKGNWTTEDGYQFATRWTTLTDVEVNDGILMHKGRTYAMLFPYCTGTGCSVVNRKEWDYWSGKFLIFESTDGTKTGGHIVNGSNLFDSIPFATTPNANEAIVSGNSTFSYLVTDDPNVYIYNPFPAMEQFEPNTTLDGNYQVSTVLPTTAILWTDIQAPASNMRVRHIKRTGEIVYDKENTPTDVNPGGNLPTVGGGNDLFITATVAGINIAVAEPQHVRVMSATGAIIYSGMVQTAVDVALPATGVYVVAGENEVHKILH